MRDINTQLTQSISLFNENRREYVSITPGAYKILDFALIILFQKQSILARGMSFIDLRPGLPESFTVARMKKKRFNFSPVRVHLEVTAA